MQLRVATDADREWIYRLRHEVYARELHQHPTNAAELLTDDLDRGNVYLVAATGSDRIGFISVTPPWLGRYAFEKYLSRDEHPELTDEPFEGRILTVAAPWRQSPAAALLIYAALRWIAARGGRRIVMMGRTQILPMYLGIGMKPLGHSIMSGAVAFELMHGEVADLTAHTLREYGGVLRRLAPSLDWRLDTPFLPGADPCEHGGASFDAIGADFATLERRHEIVAADVLDAWFPPAPGVLRALADDPGWTARTSPPAAAQGMVDAIAAARGVDPGCVVVGAGSSDLIFRAFREWLTPASRVLIVDPSYGEYAHVVEAVAGCRADRLRVRRDHGWRIDLGALRAALNTGYDLVVLVNPNNPTGVHVDADDLRAVLDTAPPSTRIFLDEAYVDYVGPGCSLESYAASSGSVVVCKSLSKVYALSGVRAAYLVASASTAAALRRWAPPWPVSLPAQLAAVNALRDPQYYAARWAQTASLRADLAAGLASVDPRLELHESVANFVLLTLPHGGPTAAQLTLACRRDGVFLRDLSPMSAGFEGRTVRVAVRDTTDNARIVQAFRDAWHRLGASSGAA